jgi:GcrA cell cycle regulator
MNMTEIAPLQTPLLLPESFIGPPAAEDVAETRAPARKAPSRKKPITTLTLTTHTCRWPVGDPVEPDFHYCGKPPLLAHPYCETHFARSYPGRKR